LFTSECTKTVWWLGSAQISWGSSLHSPGPIAGFKGWAPRNGKEGEREIKGRRREKKGGREGGRDIREEHKFYSAVTYVCTYHKFYGAVTYV